MHDFAAIDRLLPLAEAARFVGLSRRHLERMIAAQLLPPVIKQGRRSFLAESDLRAYITKMKESRSK